MMWKPCILLSEIQTAKDRLGNPVTEYEPVKETKARFTPWTNEQTELEGREVTRCEQRFAVPVPYRDFPKCSAVIMDGVTREITQVIDLSPRYTGIQVRVYKE